LKQAALLFTVMVTCHAGCAVAEDSASYSLAESEAGCAYEVAAVEGVAASDGSSCSCSVSAEAGVGYSAPRDDCLGAKDDTPFPRCARAVYHEWSRRCFIDAYLTTCCEAAAEAGCPCGGEAP